MEIKIKKLDPKAKLPVYAHPGDVGMDIFSIEYFNLEHGEQHAFKTGIAMEFEEGYAAIVKDKGGMANEQIHSAGGVFDAGYRGEYMIHLINHGKNDYPIKAGQKIAQIVIFQIIIPTFVETDELSDSARGKGRFGSTGKF